MRSFKTGNKRGGNRARRGLFNGKRGPGRPKGSVDKITRDVREMIRVFAERKAPDFERWIERCAKKDPGKAATLYLAAIEYHIPKLHRTDVRVAAFGGDVVLRTVAPEDTANAYARLIRGEVSPAAIAIAPTTGDGSQQPSSASQPLEGELTDVGRRPNGDRASAHAVIDPDTPPDVTKNDAE